MLLESKQTNKSGGSPFHNNHSPVHNNHSTSPRDVPHLFTIITLPAPEIWPRGTGSVALLVLLLVLLPQQTLSHPLPSTSISPPCNACNGGLAVRELRPLARTRPMPCRVPSASNQKKCMFLCSVASRKASYHAYICVQQGVLHWR
jgi:hypothetical protein